MASFIWDDLVWVLPVFILVLCYITGDLVQMLFKVNQGIAVKVLSGFVILLCLFHINSLPFMYNDWPFTTLYSLHLCALICIILAYAIVTIVKHRVPLQDDLERLRLVIKDIAIKRWWHFLLWAVIVGFIICHIYVVIQYVSYNVDDNFYVAQSLTTITRNRLMNVLPSCGIEGSVFPPTYLLVSWETWIAALSKMFCTTPAVLCHSILPAFLIPLHYMAFYLAGREFSRRKSALFLFFVILLNFTCGPFTYNQGAFLTLRIWQGKAVLVNILLPLLLYVFLRITKTRTLKVRNMFFLFSLLLASQAASTVGTYLAPVLYAVYAITFLITARKWKPFFQMFIPAAGIVPFVLWKLWILTNAGTLSSLSEGSGVYERSFTDLALHYFGFSLVPVLFILAIVILAVRLKKGPAKRLRFFVLTASLLLIIFLINPFVMPFAEHYITGTGVYWRMFWLLQITIVIAAAFAQLCDIPKLQLSRVTITLLLAAVLLVSGRSILKDEDIRSGFSNHSKISATTRGIAYTVQDEVKRDHPEAKEEELQKLEQETVLLLPRTLSDELRQYADISQIHYAYYSNNYYSYQTEEEFLRLKDLYDILYRKKTWDAKELYDTVSDLGIDYVAIGTPTVQNNKYNIPFWFEMVFSNERYTLYKTNGGR